MTRILVLAVMLLGPATAIAAPLCWETTGIAPQCLFTDPHSCAQQVERSGGVCSANVDELQIAAGPGEFCVIQSSLVASCTYPDRQACQVAAARAGGACVQSTSLPDAPANIDPFRVRRPY